VKSSLVVFISLLISFSSYAQKTSKVEVINADVFEFVKIGDKQIRKLKGHCAFRQDNVLLYCDSALLYQETNSVDAFGHVHIRQGDSLNLYGDLLKYDGNAKLARFNKNIRVVHNDMVLTTDILTYDTKNRVATYYEGGKIVNEENVLTSKLGYYYAKNSDAFFKKDVVMVNPKYVMNSDTLKYNTQTKISTFFGPTTIKSDEDFLYSENGTYNTKTDIAQFSKNAYYESDNQRLRGDQLYYDRKKGIGRATDNVVFTDTVQKIIIRGNKANYHKPSETVVATNKAYVTMLVEKDSLYLSADTLKSVMDTVTKLRTLFAYHDAQIFKTDLRARCDSLVYTEKDSTISCYHNPVMWSQNAQLTGDFITLNLKNQKMHKMNLYNSAFVVMVDSLDSTKFDQVRGKNMFGYFINNKLSRLDVEGNGQSVYYAKEDVKDSVVTDSVEYIGVNRAECSNMIIYFADNKVQKVNFITKPDATFYPIDELTPNELRLKGFSWREALKPKRKEDILR
jgi:lipopolysaccharide assembly outer membrane protein LptD (OstA)